MSSTFALLKRFWVVVVVVVGVVVAAIVVSRLRGFFGSELPASSGGAGSDSIAAFHPKRVTYEVIGPHATSGDVSYLDAAGQTHQASFTTLPWSYTVTTTDPGMLANVVAQGDSTTLECRITVDGTVTTEHHAQGRDAQAFCLDKAA